MASNTTSGYGLHAWEPEDHFLRTEFNENFARLDQIPEAVFGTYHGNYSSQQAISLGFTPRAVHIEIQNGVRSNGQYQGGLVLPGFPLAGGAAIIQEGGFLLVKRNTSDNLNGNTDYLYIAFR